MVRNRELSEDAAGSALVRPDAKVILERAAQAAGLTVAQLVDLVHDSGALTVPTDSPNGVNVVLTLKDLGKRMWGELQQVMQPDRVEWFQTLLPPQQIGLVVTLADQGYRSEIIARELGIAATRVREVIDQYADRVGAQVTQMRLTTIAGHVQIAAERAMEGLHQQGDWKGFFGVQKDVVKIFQGMGIIDQAIHRVEVTHKMEDNTQIEIKAMVDLEKKKQRRLDEIAQAQGQNLDAVPALELENEA